jgi:hypothetical protein
MVMSKPLRGGLGAVALAAALLGARFAYAFPPPSATIYDGSQASSAGMELKGWGSGKASEDRTKGYAGQPASIKIKSDGYYSGGRLVFIQPKDLTPQFTAPDSRYGFLVFVVQFAPNSNATPAAPTPGEPGEAAPAVQASSHTRVTLVFEEGIAEAINQPIVLEKAQEEGWYQMAVPFVAFKGTDKLKSFKLREVRLFTDKKDDLNIGEIRTTTDDEPIQVEPLENLEVSVNDTIQFSAKATAGLSTLKYTWDFDASDGIQEDASGPTVLHVFKKPSGMNAAGAPVPFIVTLTVSDISGAKKPEVRKAEVIVN